MISRSEDQAAAAAHELGQGSRVARIASRLLEVEDDSTLDAVEDLLARLGA